MDNMSWKKILFCFMCFISVGSLAWSIDEFHEIKKIENHYLKLKDQYAKLDQKRAHLNGELIDAKEKKQEALDSAQTVVNNSANNKEQQSINIKMKQDIHTAFKGLYNYTPDTFNQRANAVKNVLSDKLNQQYFGNSDAKYGDSSNVSSRLEQLDIYTKTVQGSTLQAMVNVNYSSKYDSSDSWNDGQSMYKVTYDSQTKKIKKIQQVYNKTE